MNKTIIEGTITKRENGFVTVKGIQIKLQRHHYGYTHIGDHIKAMQGLFRWKIDTIRFKNPLNRYLIGVSRA